MTYFCSSSFSLHHKSWQPHQQLSHNFYTHFLINKYKIKIIELIRQDKYCEWSVKLPRYGCTVVTDTRTFSERPFIHSSSFQKNGGKNRWIMDKQMNEPHEESSKQTNDNNLILCTLTQVALHLFLIKI